MGTSGGMICKVVLVKAYVFMDGCPHVEMRRLAVVGTKHFEAAATRLPEHLGALAEHIAIFRVKIDRGGVPSVLAEARHPVAVSRADLDHFSISEMPEQRRVDGLGRADGRGVDGRGDERTAVHG